MADIRYAVRALWRQPGPTAIVVFTLAVAIAATTVIYSAIDVVQHLIPVVRRGGLVYATSTEARAVQPGSGGRGVVLRSQVSIPDLADWSARSSTFEAFAALSLDSITLTGVEIPMRVASVRVTSNLLDLWGVGAAFGRTFHADEGRPEKSGVAMLSHAFWQREYASDERALGKTVMLDGKPHTIVGVLPSQAGTGIFRDAEVFVPLVVDSLRAARDQRTLLVTGRLKPGVTMAQAAADLDGIARRLQAEHPATNQHVGAVVLPLIEASGFNVRTLLSILGLIAALVLVVACANLSNLMLAQATRRRHEFAVRSALGAGRLAHVRQLMTESAVASVIAGVLGLVLAWWGLAALRWLGGDTLGLGEARINGRVLAVGLLTAFAAPAGFALWPALRATRPDVPDLNDGSRTVGVTRHGRRVWGAAIALQAGAAVILMLQIALLVRTTWTLSQTASGFDPAQVLTFRAGLSGARYADDESVRRFADRLTASVRALPGVVSVGLIDRLPVADREATSRLTVEGDVPAPPELRPVVSRAAISADYFQTLRVPVQRGRVFSAAELSNASAVAIVNEQAARRLLGGRDAIGARIALDATADRTEWLQVVGVVGNIRNADVDRGPQPEVYVPMSRLPGRDIAVVVKSSAADPLALVPAIRARVAALDPDQPIHDVATMSRVLFDDLAGTYVLASMLTVIGVIALSLSAVGVFGVVSYAVVQRSREIGVRMALGARPGSMVRLMMSQGTVPVAVGGIVGLILAVALAFVLATAVPEMEVRDPFGYIGVALAVALVALMASYVPARRAASIDPARALRAE